MSLHLLVLLFIRVFISNLTAQGSEVLKPECQSSCGNVTIPFPFGIGEDCYVDKEFAIDCKHNKPFLSAVPLEVRAISIKNHTMLVNHPVFNTCETQTSMVNETVNLEGTPFFFSSDENMFTGLGCLNDVFMWFQDSDDPGPTYLSGCYSVCVESKNFTTRKDGHKSCTGNNCCQTEILSSLQVFNITIRSNEYMFKGPSESMGLDQKCRYGFIVEKNWFNDHRDEVPNRTHVPVVLDWRVNESSSIVSDINGNYPNADCGNNLYNNTALCSCNEGYEGNPYLQKGCTDIDECKIHSHICPSSTKCANYEGGYYCYYPKNSKPIMIGIGTSLAGLFLFAIACWFPGVIKRRNDMKRRKEFYERNGGLLLEQQLHSMIGLIDRCKVFSSKDLDKATDHFSISRVLGQGGQGTVYKGMLEDGKIIAVKKSKVVDRWKLEEFINEVIILSQINHRNVVKLLGCCLETEVPLLVYEFIPNGTLLHYLHNRNEELRFTWDMRLRIATEVAEALSYLHSAASVPIYHRDIKSANILLDEMLRAKVADFGTSKSLAIDQTHVTTRVQGTFGYLDPEYYQSGQFTNKSDVYSFGVVLVELLTGDTPMKLKKAGNSSLSNFIVFMEENHLDDTLDAQVRSGKKDEIMAVASLAQRCINLDGKKRPTMKEVAMALERIRTSQKECKLEQNHAEIEYVKTDTIESCDIIYSSTSSTFAIEGPSINDQPLMTS